jgi:histidinol-phosphate aminotransferase
MDDFDHGATDSGKEPVADFSTCANPFGPCPRVLDSVLSADRTRYPDPSYAQLRETLGARHGVVPDRIVPGAGASELILRLVRACEGDVLAWSPSFVEYRRAAHVCGRRFLAAREPASWLELVPPDGIAFLCQPNNPDGRVHPAEFLDAATVACRSRNCRLVLDLAYADFCLESPPRPEGCDLLLAPNKQFGLTGVRAGILVSSSEAFAGSLRGLAPSWVLGSEGVAFLDAASEPSAYGWFQSTIPRLRSATDRLRSLLEGKEWELAPSSTHFFCARPPALEGAESGAELSGAWTLRLRREGIRVRDLSNVGLPGWLRFSARPPMETDDLEKTLRRVS